MLEVVLLFKISEHDLMKHFEGWWMTQNLTHIPSYFCRVTGGMCMRHYKIQRAKFRRPDIPTKVFGVE